VLASHAHGRGFATEALTAALQWIDGHIDSDRTVCIINPANAPSIGVAKKCGFLEERRSLYNGRDVIVFERSNRKMKR